MTLPGRSLWEVTASEPLRSLAPLSRRHPAVLASECAKHAERRAAHAVRTIHAKVAAAASTKAEAGPALPPAQLAQEETAPAELERASAMPDPVAVRAIDAAARAAVGRAMTTAQPQAWFVHRAMPD